MGVTDVFVYAHNCHRRNSDNPGNFGDCMEGRIRLTTAITPTCAYAYQFLCLAGRPFVVPRHNFRLPAVNARYPTLPNSRTATREKGTDFQGLATCTGGGTRASEGVTSAGWSAVAGSLEGRLHIVFGPVITTEAHLAYAGARLHPSNTAEPSSIIEALSFLGPSGPLARDSQACIFYDSRHAASICLGIVQSRANVPLRLHLPTPPVTNPVKGTNYCAARLMLSGRLCATWLSQCRRSFFQWKVLVGNGWVRHVVCSHLLGFC